MAKEKKYDRRIDAIMAWLDSLLDKKEKPKPTRISGKSLAEQINWGGKFDDTPVKRKANGGSIEKEPIDTGQRTPEGRIIWNDGVEDYSERTTTFEIDGKWYTMPTVAEDGSQYSSDTIRDYVEKLIKAGYGPTDFLTGEELPEFKSEDDALGYAESRSDTRKQEESSMDEQMSMFNEGGLLDEGGEVDKESGNKVPIGGTKEGVRDDIPAMLSEGEFVFPEDVTRYHGLEKLMTLRQEAKMGLKKMEAMGQMGNSEEATIPDDLPFTMDDLILVVGEKEPKEKDDEPIKAQAGTFVPANQQLNNMGVIGFQESMYGQQGLQNPVATVMPQVPASSVAPTVQAPQPMTGYSAPTVPATPVQQTDFVPEPSDVYKPVKYINPTTGETMTINEYQGNPVSAVPAGFIRYDDYIASGGKDPNEDVGTGVESTSVETAQVGGSSDDERKENIASLQKMRDAKEKERVEKYNKLFDTESKEFNDPNNANYITDKQLIDAYKDQIEAETVGGVMTPFLGPAGFLPRLGRGKVEKAMAARFKENWKELPQFKDITRGSVAKDAAAEIGKDFKKTFTAEGRDIFYKEYEPKYSVADDSFKKKFGGAGTGYTVLEKDEKGQTTKATGALSVREQQSFDNAVDRGDNAVADHFALVAYHRSAKDQFARNNAKDIELARAGDEDAKGRLYGGSKSSGGVRFSNSSIEEIIKYGGSSTTAVNEGRAVKQKGFKQPRLVSGNKNPSDDGDAGSKSSDKSSSSCVIATHAVASGAFHTSDKANAIDWCKKNLHDKWWGETMRKGYRYLGRKHIANGTAETVYKEFKECIEWANGKRDFTFKIAARYYYRVAQTFIVGLFVKEDI